MDLHRRTKIAGALLLGLALAVPAAFADDKDRRDDRRDAARGRDASEYGVDFGYQDGLHHGERDRDRRAGYDYRSNDWRQADRGYQKYMGARGRYIQGYRDGYVRGYEAAYYGRNGRRNDRRDDRRDDDWGRNGRYPRTGYPNGGYDSRYLAQLAQRNGYEDGVYYGQMDRRNGHSNRPTQVNGYRDADRGYSSSLGSKDLFKRYYRDAFIRGYQQGYGGGGYRR